MSVFFSYFKSCALNRVMDTGRPHPDPLSDDADRVSVFITSLILVCALKFCAVCHKWSQNHVWTIDLRVEAYNSLRAF